MSHKLPHSGITVSSEYRELVREAFPNLPVGAIREYWRHNASVREIRADLERISEKVKSCS